jgi:diacylglycerol kinase family enzyme
MPEPYLIIYNGRPGSKAGPASEKLVEELAKRGFDAHRSPTTRDGSGLGLLELDRYRAVVIVGGDGTLHQVLNGVRSSTTPFAFLGTGTVNVMSRELGLPREPAPFADMLLAGKTLSLPRTRANARRWALFLEAGFVGRIVTLVNAYRSRKGSHGQREFVHYALTTLPRSWGRPVQVSLELTDGTVVQRAYSNVLLTRARLYAGTMPMPINPEIEEPLAERSFESVGYRSRTPVGHLLILKLGALRLLPLLRRTLVSLRLVECLRATGARIEGPPALGSHLDAETFGEVPMDVKFEEESYRFIVS